MAVSTEPDPQLHYRSAVVENITTLLNIWLSPAFQHDIATDRHRAMSGLEVRILWTLSSLGPRRSADMAAHLVVGAAAVSKAVAKLDAAGLVTREPNPIDQRSHTLHLSDEGRRAAQELYDVGDTMVNEIFTDWDKNDVTQLSTLLSRFVAESEGYARRIHRDDSR